MPTDTLLEHPAGIFVESGLALLFKLEDELVARTPNIEANINTEKNIAINNFNLLLFLDLKNFIDFIYSIPPKYIAIISIPVVIPIIPPRIIVERFFISWIASFSVISFSIFTHLPPGIQEKLLGSASSGTLITSYYYDCSVIDPTFSVPGIYYSDDDDGDLITGYSIGTVTVTITDPSGTTSSWSHAFNSNNIGPGASNECAYVIVTPSISFSNSYSGTFSVSITETNDGDNGYDVGTNSYSLNSGNFITDGSANGNSIVTSEPSQSSTSTMYGWHYGSTSTTLTIPQYETSYDISWSSNAETNPVYNSDSQSASSGTFTGSLTDNSITINPVGDPDLVSALLDQDIS